MECGQITQSLNLTISGVLGGDQSYTHRKMFTYYMCANHDRPIYGFPEMGVSPIAGWFILANPIYKWMIFGDPSLPFIDVSRFIVDDEPNF